MNQGFIKVPCLLASLQSLCRFCFPLAAFEKYLSNSNNNIILLGKVYSDLITSIGKCSRKDNMNNLLAK